MRRKIYKNKLTNELYGCKAMKKNYARYFDYMFIIKLDKNEIDHIEKYGFVVKSINNQNVKIDIGELNIRG